MKAEWGDVTQSVYEQAAERDGEVCQDCGRPSGPPHHIVRKGYFGKHGKRRAEVVSNLICLCMSCHFRAHTKEAQRRHLTHLRAKYGYPYDEQPWSGLLGEA